MTAPAPDYIECNTCRRMFPDTDGTRVCPSGHENAWATDEDEHTEHLNGVTW
ncbi:hypothetical protein ACXYX3_17845 [Mycobacterium sp. C3-094]